ncbi:MAG: DUF4234 domain-containing protein [Bacillota bacterium]
MKSRNIYLMILFSVLTLGLYLLFWSCSFQKQLKKETGEGLDASSHFFAVIFTLGVYFVVWQYRAGKRIATLGCADNSGIYLVLFFLALGLVNPFIMQSQVNNIKKLPPKPERRVYRTHRK